MMLTMMMMMMMVVVVVCVQMAMVIVTLHAVGDSCDVDDDGAVLASLAF